VSDAQPATDRFARSWRDAQGAEWRAQVDRIALSCGACDLTRYLHIYAPTGGLPTTCSSSRRVAGRPPYRAST